MKIDIILNLDRNRETGVLSAEARSLSLKLSWLWVSCRATKKNKFISSSVNISLKATMTKSWQCEQHVYLTELWIKWSLLYELTDQNDNVYKLQLQCDNVLNRTLSHDILYILKSELSHSMALSDTEIHIFGDLYMQKSSGKLFSRNSRIRIRNFNWPISTGFGDLV
jgi:hypothetical protein